ncbi:MAG: hypothetical protein NTZ17_02800 [Phycisphaerae bacterium]|nr:hypothetical protein [Phycisphaerae bacterium]
MSNIERRIEKAEQTLSMDADGDTPFVLEVASGVRFTATRRQLREIFADIQRSNSRLLPKGAYHEESIETR